MDAQEGAELIYELAQALADEHGYNERRTGHIPSCCGTCIQIWKAFACAAGYVSIESEEMADLKD